MGQVAALRAATNSDVVFVAEVLSLMASSAASAILCRSSPICGNAWSFRPRLQDDQGVLKRVSECARYIEEGHFPAGSMGPKVDAIHDFLLHGGRRGLITNPERLGAALEGEAGTHFVGRI